VLKPSPYTQMYRNAIVQRMYKMDKIKFWCSFHSGRFFLSYHKLW
jgi:hypothetical protein